MNFILTRHGETKSNKDHVIQGHTDTELNDTGVMQAKEAASHLKDGEFKIAICSDLKRATHTAQIMMSELNSNKIVTTNPKLREMNYGTFQGTDKDAFDIYDFDQQEKIGGGESVYDVYKRIADFTNNIVNKAPEDYTVLVISHRGPLAALLHMAGEADSYLHNVQNAHPIRISIDKPVIIPENLIKYPL